MFLRPRMSKTPRLVFTKKPKFNVNFADKIYKNPIQSIETGLKWVENNNN